MSPLNRGPLLGPRMPPAGMRPPLPRFGIGRLLPMPGMSPRMPPPPPGPMFGPMRQRMMPPRPGPMMGREARSRGGVPPPLMPPAMMGPRGLGPRGGGIHLMRPGPRGLLPPQGLLHMRPRFPIGNGNIRMKQAISSAKKASKLEELELKKPWMTDEIRNEIQKKNKLYAKAKKNKVAKEWDEFKDLRNKVTRMIRDAKNEYLAKNPEQAPIYQDDEQEPYDQRDENNCANSEGGETDDNDDTSHYCEVCDREFNTGELLERHIGTHKSCGIDGCTFSAHPKLVEKHISMQHSTGLYHRMRNLSTPEDVEKWIAERKKKYPTKINLEKKEAARIEKRERGEIIVEKERRYRGTAKSVIRSDNKRQKLRKRKTREYGDKPKTMIQLYQGLRPFAGTANLRKYINENEIHQGEMMERNLEKSMDTELPRGTCEISDDEDDVIQHQCNGGGSGAPIPKLSQVEPTIENQSGLASLMANYGSDSEEDEGPDEAPIMRTKSEHHPETDSTIPPTNPMQSPAEPISSSQTPIIQNTRKMRANVREKTKFVKNEEKSRHENIEPRQTMPANINNVNQKRLMLLQRLLSRSIQHERNLICQCIKYIADNNYFT